MTAELEVQYRALRGSCGWWHRPGMAAIVLTGADSRRLLNGLVTCNVAGLAPGQGVQGFFTDIKGHILAEVVVRARLDSLLLELAADRVDPVAAHIEKYIVADRVEVRSPVEFDLSTLLGPAAADWLTTGLGTGKRPSTAWGHVDVELGGAPVLVAADGHFGIPAISLWQPTGSAVDLLVTMSGGGDRAPLVEVGDAAVETIRIIEGVPRFGQDYGPENLPQETGLTEAVDFDKGCYLGQEVIARLHYRGQAARCVTRLAGSELDQPSVGTALFLDEREAGSVSSVTTQPGGDKIWALAMLQRRACAPGTRLQLDSGGSLQVV